MPCYTHKMAIISWPQILWRHFTLFCSLAILDPWVGHTMDVFLHLSLSCHSDWLFYGESCPSLDVVHPDRAWPSLPACTWHCSLHYLFLQATPLYTKLQDFLYLLIVPNATTVPTSHCASWRWTEVPTVCRSWECRRVPWQGCVSADCRTTRRRCRDLETPHPESALHSII